MWKALRRAGKQVGRDRVARLMRQNAIQGAGMRLREIAATLGITERSAYAIVNDLTEAGYVVKDKGRPSQPLPDPGRSTPARTHRSRADDRRGARTPGGHQCNVSRAARPQRRFGRTRPNRRQTCPGIVNEKPPLSTNSRPHLAKDRGAMPLCLGER